MTSAVSDIELSAAHLDAINRRRRVVFNFDVTAAINSRYEQFNDLDSFIDDLFTFADEPGSQVDAIWWNWGEGNQSPYPSSLMPLYDHPLYKKWADQGTDIVERITNATRQRGREVFFSCRMNGGDNDLGPVAEIPLKTQNPQWLIPRPWAKGKYANWNYAIPQVRQIQLEKIREALERWDFDGIELDFGRGAPFARDEQWIQREHLTGFMHDIRMMTLEIARQRGRPLLVATRVGDTLLESHMDGLDVETWIDRKLVDLLVLGIRNFNVDVPTYYRLTRDTPIKIYPALDDHHASDGYCYPPIEVFRGAFNNWYHQGADGIQTFNFAYAPGAIGGEVPLNPEEAQGPVGLHRQAQREMGDPQLLKPLDKTFVLNRRGGGHGPIVHPNPEDWHTPRHVFANTCSLAPLPVELDNKGKSDTLLTLYVSDDLHESANRLGELTLRVLLNDPETETLTAEKKIETAVIRLWRNRDFFYNSPPAKGIEQQLEVRVNNILLEKPSIEQGWLVFTNLESAAWAVGNNLIGLHIVDPRQDDQRPILIEKVELHVKYG